MNFSEKTRNDLEWFKLLEHIAVRSTGEEAAEACLQIPFREPDDAWNYMRLVDELCSCIRKDDPPPALPAFQADEALAHIRSEGSITSESLLGIAVNLKLFVALARFFENRKDVCSQNLSLLLPEGSDVSTISLARLAAEIESVFEPDGTISDTASRELGRLRRRVVSLRANLLNQISAVAEAQADLLQDSTVTMRNDRFVLPVRADAHRRLKGIVHGTSGTGATMFVEPESVVEVGNDLTLAGEAVLREEFRILSELRSAVRDQLKEVSYACGALVESEVRISVARLAFDLDAHVPVRGEPGAMELVRAGHPLLILDKAKVIPSTISISPGSCLLISGPNAGGKTVLIKTVGIIGLMINAGLPVPVNPESVIGSPSNILTDIGDGQSLDLNLSTFSAHMKNIASILSDAAKGAVVLLDELATGTDPVEGTALAEAVMSRLNTFGAATLATTHFDNLKIKAQEAQGFTNVAMGFNSQEGVPTFMLHIGVPGNSSAIAVAQKYGIPQSVLEQAKALMPDGARRLAKAVEDLEIEKQKLSIERQAVLEQSRELKTSSARHIVEIKKFKSRQGKFIDKETEDLWTSIRSAREKIRDAEKRVKSRKVDQKIVQSTRREINKIAEKLAPMGTLNPKDEKDLPGRSADPVDIKPGVRVYVTSMNANALVDTALKGNTAYVRAGVLRMRVTIDELRILDAKSGGNRKSKKHRPKTALADGYISEDPIRTSNNTLDLRGKTVDEAIIETEEYLDSAMRNGTDVIFVLHGHGTDALKDAIRTMLKDSRYVERFRAGEKAEGGDGITAVWLR